MGCSSSHIPHQKMINYREDSENETSTTWDCRGEPDGEVCSNTSKDDQKKSDLSKCPAHLFVVSKTKQKIEVKPAKTEDVLKLQKWWTHWTGVDGVHFEKGVIVAQKLLGTFSRWFECTWPFLTPRKGEITICQNNTFKIFGFVRSVVCEPSTLLSQVDSWFECWMFFARMFSGFTYFGHPLTTQDYDITWNDNMEMVILKIIHDKYFNSEHFAI